jgi:glycosyltransferase involved in cell wall biosynthesis
VGKKIRIAFIIDELNLGGTELQLISLIKRLNRDKFSPYLICLRDSEWSEARQLNCQRVILGVRKLISYGGIKGLIRLVFFMRKEKIDVLQTFFFDSNVFGVIAGTLGGVPVIISSRRDLGFWYSPRLLWILRILDRWVDYYLVNSLAVKENISKVEQVNPKKISVIYNGIDLEPYERINSVLRSEVRRKLGILPEEIIIGILSNLNRPVKRVDIFLRAAGEVYKFHKNAIFVVVGDGCLKDELMQLASKLGIEERTYFIGLQEDVIPHLASFDIAICTSDSEGFSSAIVEYMAAGIPSIVTEVSGNKELVAHGLTGKVVPRGDYKAVANEICSLIENEMERKRLGEAGQRVVWERYSWGKKIKEFEAEYLSLNRTKSRVNDLEE